jgi:polyhydroxybutyrate depolymerase
MIASYLFATQLMQPIQSITVNGVERTFQIIVPKTKMANLPVIFGFHGHGGGIRNASLSFALQRRWPEAVVVYMQGLPTKGMTDPEGKKRGWQQAVGEYEDRDIKFFDAVYEKVVKENSVDKRRVFSMGHSNGARFSFVLWEARPDLFKGFGISGSPVQFKTTLKPKPMFQLTGETDPIVKPVGQYLTTERLIKSNGLDKDKAIKDGYKTTYPGQFPIVTWIHPGGHNFPADGADAMIEFLKSQ